MRTVYVIGTCDTKGEELAFAVECVRGAGAKAVLVGNRGNAATAVASRFFMDFLKLKTKKPAD